MTLKYRYTDGVTATSISGNTGLTGTPYDTARTGVTAHTRPTNRQGIWQAIRDAVVAAGWTEYSLASNDSMFISTGESGTEAIAVRVSYNGTNTIYFEIGVKAVTGNTSIQNGFGGNVGNFRFTISTDFTSDYHILVNKDYCWFSFHSTARDTNIYSGFFGLLKRRGVGVKATAMTLSSSATAGEFVTLNVSSFNPITLGYKPGETIQIVDTVQGATCFAERCIITKVTSNSLTVRNLLHSYSSGSHLGSLAMPVCLMTLSNADITAGAATLNLMSYYQNRGIGEDKSTDTTDERNEIILSAMGSVSATNPHSASGEFGDSSVTNRLTTRRIGRELIVRTAGNLDANVERETILGVFPGIIDIAVTTPTTYPHDYYTVDRATPNQDYVLFKTTNTGTVFCAIGPTPGP